MIKSWTNEANGFDGPLEILEDNRWGWTKYYIGVRGEPLLIHPGVRNCVAFLGRKYRGQDDIIATAFFLSIKIGYLHFPYLVTAGHVIEHAKDPSWSDDGFVYLYLNGKHGARFQPMPTKIEHWYFHPTDGAVDVAVLPFRMLPEADHTAVEFELSPEVEANPKRWRIDVGTDVFITGLFLRHKGRERNIPIVRTGTIAALPDKKEPVDIGDPSADEERNIEAYLVETHSMHGLSGSPVFANPFDVRSGPKFGLVAMHIWIGVVSAHWDVDQDKREKRKINSGIAIVSPKESVWEVLQHPRLVEMREQEFKQKRKSNAPTMDDASEPLTQKTRAPKPEDRIDIPIPTRGQFEGDLAKAMRKKK
jgi:hypothetical protein